MTNEQEQLLRDIQKALLEAHKLEHLQDVKFMDSVRARVELILKKVTRQKADPLSRALRLQEQINQRVIEQDELLAPLCQKAMKSGEEAVRHLMAQIPSGFHRTELQTWLNKRRGY